MLRPKTFENCFYTLRRCLRHAYEHVGDHVSARRCAFAAGRARICAPLSLHVSKACSSVFWKTRPQTYNQHILYEKLKHKIPKSVYGKLKKVQPYKKTNFTKNTKSTTCELCILYEQQNNSLKLLFVFVFSYIF